MKKVIPSFLIVMALFVAATHVQDDNKGLGRVQKIRGKEIYIFCEPLREYQVVDHINEFGFSSQCKIRNLAGVMMNKAEHKDVAFDALLIDSGTGGASLIKFKE